MRPIDLDKLITFHTELNPKLWYDNNLRREVRYNLLLIAKEFVKFINIPDFTLEDITISGSNCSYNYNDQSDIDLHLVVSSDSPCWPHLSELYLAKKTLFNDQHDIKLRDIDVEVYVQDSKQPHISNGIFSVLNDEWLKQPRMITADVDETNVADKYKSLKFQIQIAVASEELNKLRDMQDKVKRIRKSGLARHGEFGPENLVFKLLRNDGTLGELYAAAAEAEDKRLSIPEVNLRYDPKFKLATHMYDKGYGVTPPTQWADIGKNMVINPDKPTIIGPGGKKQLAPGIKGMVKQQGRQLYDPGTYKDYHRMAYSQEDPDDIDTDDTEMIQEPIDENFADGKGPGRPGDSQRHGIPKGATMAELEKASHAKDRKGQLARWQMNMRRGHKKESVEEEYGSAMTPQALRTRMNKLMNDDQKYTDPTQRTNWQDGVWRFITSNQAAIFADKGNTGNGDYPAAPYAAWLLVQHMDAHPERQSRFYIKLSKAFPNHPKLQFLKDRSAVNAWILKNANNPEYYVNGKPLPDPTVNVRNPAMFKDAAVKATSREEALANAEQAGNKLLVAAVKATNAQTQPSYTQQSESVNETRDAAFAWIKSKLPKWPDYVLRDWIYNSVRGDFGPESVHTEQHLRTVLAGEGMDADTQWQLVPNFKFSFQTLNPWTVDKIKARWGGESDMGMGIPKDAERHATQAALAQQQGGVRKEPVILKKIGNQYELIEGWHRTIQHFKQFPNGYTGPAWVATNARPVSESGGPDMSRRGFLGGLGALVASSGLPKVAAGALQQILGITTPEHLENMQYALKSRGTLLQLTNDELDKISSAIKGAPLDTWPGFRGTHKSVYGNPLIDQAYRKLTGEDMKAARVARILKDNSIDPVKFFESPTVKAVIGKVRQEIAAKWAQSGASDEPFKSPGEPPKLDKAAEPKQINKTATKQLAKPKYKGLADPDEEEELAIGRAGVTETKSVTKPLIKEPFKDPVAVLRKYLDKMKSPNNDRIDLLMLKIANRQGIGVDLLHKMWVDKYKKTPGVYCGIKKVEKR